MKGARDSLFDANREMLADASEQVARAMAAKGTVNGMTIEDYRQAALLGVWRSLGKYRRELGELRPWAIQQARRAILDEIRACDEVGRSRRRDGLVGPDTSLEALAGMATGGCLRELTASPRHADRLDAAQALEARLSGLGLDERERVVLYLVSVLDHEHYEAAAVLDLPEAMVQEIHEGAMARLRGPGPAKGRGRGARGAKARKRKTKFASAGGPCGPLFTQGSEN